MSPAAPFTVNHTVLNLAGPPVLIDVALVAVFGMQHSIMARPGFKAWLTRSVPDYAERSVYVLASSLTLGLLMVAWQPMPSVVWDVGAAAPLVWAVFAVGWIMVFAAALLIDSFELFGPKQGFAGRVEPSPFKSPWLYRQVRHPIMLGFLLAMWAAQS